MHNVTGSREVYLKPPVGVKNGKGSAFCLELFVHEDKVRAEVLSCNQSQAPECVSSSIMSGHARMIPMTVMRNLSATSLIHSKREKQNLGAKKVVATPPNAQKVNPFLLPDIMLNDLTHGVVRESCHHVAKQLCA
jgi:hypothetical protein